VRDHRGPWRARRRRSIMPAAHAAACGSCRFWHLIADRTRVGRLAPDSGKQRDLTQEEVGRVRRIRAQRRSRSCWHGAAGGRCMLRGVRDRARLAGPEPLPVVSGSGEVWWSGARCSASVPGVAVRRCPTARRSGARQARSHWSSTSCAAEAPVVAVEDGTLARLSEQPRGGISVEHSTAAERHCFV